MDNFIKNATYFWSSAKANILTGVDVIMDDTGIDPIDISPEFTNTNEKFVYIMQRTNHIINAVNKLCKRLIKFSESQYNLALMFTMIYEKPETELGGTSQKFLECADKVKQIVEQYAKIKILTDLRYPVAQIHADGSVLYNVRNDIKTNFLMHQKFSKEYENHHSRYSDEYILTNLLKNVENHYRLYQDGIIQFTETVDKLSNRLKQVDSEIITIYSILERNFTKEIIKVFSSVDSYNPEFYVTNDIFVNVSDHEDDDMNVKVTLDIDCPSLEQL